MSAAIRARKHTAPFLWAGWFLLIAAATVGLLRWRDAVASRRNSSPLPVVDRLKAERLLPARLSGGFRYAPYDPKAERDPVLLRQVSQESSRTRLLRGSSAPLEALSSKAWLALAAEPGDWRQALLSLETAKASFPESPEVWNNLSAVRYSLALEPGEPIDFLPALDAAEQALALDPRMPEALFNRALGLEALGIWQEAKKAWEGYLAEDGTSGWADEARQHLQKLRIPEPGRWPEAELTVAALGGDLAAVREIVLAFRSPSRRLLEEEILRQWGAAVLEGEPGRAQAEALLRAARTIAAAYEELSEDTLYREAVEILDGAAGARSMELATAHRDFADAVRAIDEGEDIDRAGLLLAAAQTAFGDSPFAWRAELKLAIVDQRRYHYPETLGRLSRLREGLGESRYPLLRGESYWVEGTTRKYLDDWDRAAEAYRRALPLFEATGEAEQSAGVVDLQAELLDATGQAGETWRLLQPLLDEAGKLQSKRRLYQIYSAAAISAWVAGYPRVGLLYLQELAPWTESNPQYPVDSSLWRARLLHSLGSPSRARESISEARDKLPEVPAEDSRLSLEAEIRAVEGEMAVTGDPAAAVELLEATLEFYRTRGDQVWEKSVLLQLGRALRHRANPQAAREKLVASLDLTEKERRQLPEGERISLLEADGGAFAELIDLEFRSNRPRQALAWSEQRRSRVLLDRFAGAGAAILTIEEIQRQLPPDLTLIEYALVRGRWLAWVITSREVRGIDLQIGEAALATRVERWVLDIQRGLLWSELRDDASELYRALILPLGLPGEGDWVIVPEGVLKDLPFAALFDGERFVIERHALSVAPSANFFLGARQRDRSRPASESLRALVLGNPTFDLQKFPTLRDLPGAELEATRIAQLYGVPPDLRERATPGRFLRGAPESEIVQISAHAQTRPESPLDSALLLSGGVVTAQEIQRLPLDRTRLVVLSACSTASGPSRGGEGAESLAGAFLAAGVPGVVATLWNVEDQPTSELVIEFHRQLRRGGDARQALQKAQLAFLKRPLAAWAAFQLIGEASLQSSGDGSGGQLQAKERKAR